MRRTLAAFVACAALTWAGYRATPPAPGAVSALDPSAVESIRGGSGCNHMDTGSVTCNTSGGTTPCPGSAQGICTKGNGTYPCANVTKTDYARCGAGVGFHCTESSGNPCASFTWGPVDMNNNCPGQCTSSSLACGPISYFTNSYACP